MSVKRDTATKLAKMMAEHYSTVAPMKPINGDTAADFHAWKIYLCAKRIQLSPTHEVYSNPESHQADRWDRDTNAMRVVVDKEIEENCKEDPDRFPRGIGRYYRVYETEGPEAFLKSSIKRLP